MESLQEMRKRILELAEPIDAIEVPLSEAVGLVLAEPHFADVDLPPFDRSALAGYALRAADTTPGRSLRLLDDPKIAAPPASATVPLSSRAEPAESDAGRRDFDFGFGFEGDFDFAGFDDENELFSPFEDDDEPDHNADLKAKNREEESQPFDFGLELGPDEAVWVNQWDPMPIGADAVAAPDQVIAEPGLGGGPPRHILVRGRIDAGGNVLPRGHFLRAGTELDQAGTRLKPSMVSLLAAQGCVHPICHRRVRLAVLAVGDQLVPPNEEPILHRERNAAGLTLAIPCIQWGTMVHDLGAVPLADLDQALYRASTAQVVLMMAPDSQPISAALAKLGVEIRVSGVSLDPCDDLTYGILRGESGRIESHIFRLSPRPVAALLSTMLLVGPLVARLQGETQPELHKRRAIWTGRQEPTENQTRVVPVKIEAGDDARLHASPISYRGLDDLAGFAQADALAVFPPNSGPWNGGEIVEFVPIGQGHDLARH